MGPDEDFLNASWCSSLNYINYSSCFSKLWSDGEVLAWNFLSLITLFWMCFDENMFGFSFRSYLICFRLSSCLLKTWSAVSRDTFTSLADESIMIFCCFSWYVYIKFWSSYSSCLLLWSHCYWNIFSLLDKWSIKSFFCLSNKYFVLFVAICFSQLLKFFLFLFTPLISFFLKLLQFYG